MEPPVEVRHEPARPRFVVELDGRTAELTYRRVRHRLVLIHTGVPDELEGRGIGGELVRAAVALAVAEDLTVVPRCPFARGWLERHPEVAAQVAVDWAPPPA
jgi:predicted GNAT family acetyltransferase